MILSEGARFYVRKGILYFPKLRSSVMVKTCVHQYTQAPSEDHTERQLINTLLMILFLSNIIHMNFIHWESNPELGLFGNARRFISFLLKHSLESVL